MPSGLLDGETEIFCIATLAAQELGMPEGTVKDAMRLAFGERRNKQAMPELWPHLFEIINEECDDPETARFEVECLKELLPDLFGAGDPSLDPCESNGEEGPSEAV